MQRRSAHQQANSIRSSRRHARRFTLVLVVVRGDHLDSLRSLAAARGSDNKIEREQKELRCAWGREMTRCRQAKVTASVEGRRWEKNGGSEVEAGG